MALKDNFIMVRLRTTILFIICLSDYPRPIFCPFAGSNLAFVCHVVANVELLLVKYYSQVVKGGYGVGNNILA